jgi:hypothetical protein
MRRIARCLLVTGLIGWLHVTGAQGVHAQTKATQADGRPVEAGVRDALRQYATAFQSLDAASVKKVQPSANVASLQNAFKEMRSLEVSIDDIVVLSQDATATRVSCRVRQTLTPRAGARKSIDVIRVVRLRKQNNVWAIDAFER